LGRSRKAVLTVPRNSLSPLEVVKRQTKDDAELDPEVKACLLSEARALQRDGLQRSAQDVAIGLLFCRRVLLTAIPDGRLKTPEGLTLIVRILEQIHKGRSALRRAGRGGSWRVPPLAQPVQVVEEEATEPGAGAAGG
jgi:hypothetical protein